METNKELLLRDLSARLPYEVKVKFYDHWVDEYEIIPLTAKLLAETVYIGDIKPYLFPLSSMTEDQHAELLANGVSDDPYTYIDGKAFNYLIDFYNKNHFDYRGLIERGLALDATGLNIY